MGIAVFSSSDTACRAATRRFEIALVASLLLHALFGTAFVIETATMERRRASPSPITVRIAPQAPVQDEPLLAPRAEPLQTAIREKPQQPPPANTLPLRSEAASLALPQTPDPTYYLARDLDAYPRPAAPLELDRFAAEAATRLRFSLAIDESGSVREVTAIETQPGQRVQDEVRALLAATRFIPGRKDGRSVRSRVVLDVSVGAAR